MIVCNICKLEKYTWGLPRKTFTTEKCGYDFVFLLNEISRNNSIGGGVGMGEESL